MKGTSMADFKDQPDLGPVAEARDDGDALGKAEASQTVHLNEEFVKEQGAERAQALGDVLREVAGSRGDADPGELRDLIASRLSEAGVELSPVEVDRYAERIHRGETLDVAPPEPHSAP